MRVCAYICPSGEILGYLLRIITIIPVVLLLVIIIIIIIITCPDNKMTALGVIVCVLSSLLMSQTTSSSGYYILYDVFSTASPSEIKAALDGFTVIFSYKVLMPFCTWPKLCGALD